MPKGRGFLVQRPLHHLQRIGVLHDFPKREFPCVPRYYLYPIAEARGFTAFSDKLKWYHLVSHPATSGSYHEAGLPNIEGSISSFNNYWFAVANRQVGALYTNNPTTTDASRYANMTGTVMDNNRGASMVNFDASKSNTLYGLSTTVQPNSFTVRYIIKY